MHNQTLAPCVGIQIHKVQPPVIEKSNEGVYGLTLNEIKEQSANNKHTIRQSGLFELQTANQAIMDALLQPDPKHLYPQLIQEMEFVIIFADTGIGKTIFSIQTAIYIAQQGHIVLYLDLELSKKQFQRRYTDEYGNPYSMPDTLYRVGYSRMRAATDIADYTTYFINNVKQLLNHTGAKILYIDNLTKLSTGSTDTAKDTIPILNALNALQTEYSLTIVAIEHNKKVDNSRPIALNDLQGSKMKANLCDTILSIGRSASDSNIRYIKQVKVRDGEHLFDTENVIQYQLGRNNGYLSFEFIGYGSEYDLLKQASADDKEQRKENAISLHKQGIPKREIARQLNVSEGTIRSILKSA